VSWREILGVKPEQAPAQIVRLDNPNTVTIRSCPGCKYQVAQLLIDASRVDLDCPDCGKHKLSEFQAVTS
jgi:predicted RNA-binding Zn-ribbon protein involved in translation (DUF1610 family)